MIRGNRTERGKSASERVFEREGLQRFLEGFRGSQRFSRGFSGVLRDPLRGRFPFQRLSALLPLLVLPLELSPSLEIFRTLFEFLRVD